MAASMFVMNEKLFEIDKCPICHDPFKDPRSLPCVHTFCCECISRCITTARRNPSDQMRCPMCREDFLVPEGGGAGLPKNIFITQTVELKRLSSAMAEEMACEVCEKPASAVKMCTTCIQRLCEACCKSHEKIRTTRTHRLFSLRRSSEESDEVAKMMRTYCKEHDERIVEMYCNKCEEVMCLLCHALKHCGHDCLHVDKVAEMLRQKMEEDIRVVTSVVNRDNGQIAQIDKELEMLENSRITAKAEIAKCVEALKANIEEKAKELNAKADRLAKERKQEIEKTRAEIQKSAALKQGFHNYLREMHKNGTSVDMVRDAGKLHARANDIDQQPTVHDGNQAQYIKFNSYFSVGMTCNGSAEVGNISLASTRQLKKKQR